MNRSAPASDRRPGREVGAARYHARAPPAVTGCAARSAEVPLIDTLSLLAITGLSIALLLALILWLRLPAFLALLIASLAAAVLGGLAPAEIPGVLQQAMGGTLGYIAVVIGVGAVFGGLLERSGGARQIARSMVSVLGPRRTPLALAAAGLVVAIPVFFDVAFILFVPLVFGLAAAAGRRPLELAFPLLAGLAVGHAFVPPTPGPVAVAGILGADLGWVIAIGLGAGIPAILLAGVPFGLRAARRLGVVEAPSASPPTGDAQGSPDQAPGGPATWLASALVALPLLLILGATAAKALRPGAWGLVELLGHPFSALILATCLAWWLLGRRRGLSRTELAATGGSALEPVGQIVLVTGAGGVFGKVLVAIGVGDAVSAAVSTLGVPLVPLAFLLAAAVRVAQGSATVAMVTTAGLLSPLLDGRALSGPTLGAIVVSVAAGGTVASHVNDSGFWLVSRYLGLSEHQTLSSWTVLTTLLGVTGFLFAWGWSAIL